MSVEDFKSKFPKIKTFGFICWNCFVVVKSRVWQDKCECGYIFNHAGVSAEYAVEKCGCGGFRVINNNEILGCTKCTKVTTLALGNTLDNDILIQKLNMHPIPLGEQKS